LVEIEIVKYSLDTLIDASELAVSLKIALCKMYVCL